MSNKHFKSITPARCPKCKAQAFIADEGCFNCLFLAPDIGYENYRDTMDNIDDSQLREQFEESRIVTDDDFCIQYDVVFK